MAAEKRVPVSTSWGSVLNYTLFGTETSGLNPRQMTFSGGSASLEARAFSPYGAFTQTGIVGSTTTRDMTMLRLDSTFSVKSRTRSTPLPGRRQSFRLLAQLDPPDPIRRLSSATQFRLAIGSCHRAIAFVLRQRRRALDARCLSRQFQDLHPGGAAGPVRGEQPAAHLGRGSTAGAARRLGPRGRDHAAVLHLAAVAQGRPHLFLGRDRGAAHPLWGQLERLRGQGIRLHERAPWRRRLADARGPCRVGGEPLQRRCRPARTHRQSRSVVGGGSRQLVRRASGRAELHCLRNKDLGHHLQRQLDLHLHELQRPRLGDGAASARSSTSMFHRHRSRLPPRRSTGSPSAFACRTIQVSA